jgi:integrase
MLCVKCGVNIPDESIFCNMCGKKQVTQKQGGKKTRGNGQGSVYKLKNGKWRAAKTLGYYTDDNGNVRRSVITKSTFTTKKDAVKWLAEEHEAKKKKKEPTFKELYDQWYPTHNASRDTLNCYNAAMKYFKPLWGNKLPDIDIDDLQECLDDCPKGKRTKQNMKAACGLVYKFGIPRNLIPNNMNLAQFLRVTGESTESKAALTMDDVEKIRSCVGVVKGANYVYSQIYLGFRPSEFLGLDAEKYDKKEKAFIGGGKTEAGTNRIVTVSPKIAPIIDKLTERKASGPVFCSDDGSRMSIKEYRKLFYGVLEAAGIDNPTEETNGVLRHKYTPHSCRHTFATMLKRVAGADKDKLELIGHSSDEMLRYYQDVSLEDLRKITDLL